MAFAMNTIASFIRGRPLWRLTNSRTQPDHIAARVNLTSFDHPFVHFHEKLRLFRDAVLAAKVFRVDLLQRPCHGSNNLRVESHGVRMLLLRGLVMLG